jgi:hypothetical protein
MRGQTVEQVEALILSSERCFSDLMRQALEQAQCHHRSSPENLIHPSPNETGCFEEFKDGSSKAMDDSPLHGVLADPNENLSDLFD